MNLASPHQSKEASRFIKLFSDERFDGAIKLNHINVNRQSLARLFQHAHFVKKAHIRDLCLRTTVQLHIRTIRFSISKTARTWLYEACVETMIAAKQMTSLAVSKPGVAILSWYLDFLVRIKGTTPNTFTFEDGVRYCKSVLEIE